MNDSLDCLVDNLTRNLYNTKCKRCMKCVKMMALNGVKKSCKKNYQIIAKNVTKYKKTVSIVLNMQKQDKTLHFYV